MEINLIYLVGIIIATSIIGAILGYYTRQTIAKKQAGSIEDKLNKLVTQAKEEAKETLLAAKEKSGKILEEIKGYEREKQKQLTRTEERLFKKEQTLDQKDLQLEKDYAELKSKAKKVKKIKDELLALREKESKKLEKISGLTQEQAKSELLTIVEKEQQQVILERTSRLEKEGKEELDKKAQRLIALAMQRYASSLASETTSTIVDLPNDDMKGRIIGKEGRNIKALERLTGVEILVDDTPGAIVVSGFDPMRRQINADAFERHFFDPKTLAQINLITGLANLDRISQLTVELADADLQMPHLTDYQRHI